ncbi:MAG: fibrobacter succinogenes major paralogous domain-containing protein [Fibromonadaceae bacterium]|nr:fibrobacter succinogenes major paralogous domain-containing protein [Fibromonadaceae bacterium]
MRTKLNRKGVAGYAPTSTAFLSLAFLTILGCGAHSLEDLLNAGSSSSEAFSSLPSSSSLSSSSSGNGGGSGSLTYQGKTYRTVVIGTQTWMAENLNYDVSGSKCYDNKTENCDKYGRMYDWSMAMALPSSCNSASTSCSGQVNAKHKGICPSGWHIPSEADWDKLIRYVDGDTGTSNPYDSRTASWYLNATSGWNYGNGEDTYGFSALPGGFVLGGFSGGNFSSVGDQGYWWSSLEEEGNGYYYARFRYVTSNGYDVYVMQYYLDKSSLFSVRCVKD